MTEFDDDAPEQGVEESYPDGRRTVTFTVNGQRHRVDGPAYLEYAPGGHLTGETYYRHDEIHREDGPADLYYYPDGSLEAEEWFRSGREHRDGGPARTEYRGDGTVSEQAWVRDGRKHRVGGPALLVYDEDGTVKNEEWHRNGRHSRIDGVAHFGNALAKRLHFTFTGVEYESLAELHADLGRYPESVVREHLVGSIYEPLLADHDVPSIIAALATGVHTLDGVREVIAGAPGEWVRAYEDGAAS